MLWEQSITGRREMTFFVYIYLENLLTDLLALSLIFIFQRAFSLYVS